MITVVAYPPRRTVARTGARHEVTVLVAATLTSMTTCVTIVTVVTATLALVALVTGLAAAFTGLYNVSSHPPVTA